MPCPVVYEGEQLTTGAEGSAQMTVHDVTEEVEQVEVLPFIIPSDAVGFAGGTLGHHDLEGGAVIFDI